MESVPDFTAWQLYRRSKGAQKQQVLTSCRAGGFDKSLADHVLHHCCLVLLIQQLNHEPVQLGHPAVCGAPL